MAIIIGAGMLHFMAKEKFLQLQSQEIDIFLISLLIGMFLGARLTYVFVYNWEFYSFHYQDIFSVWKGGLSFHGAVLGMCLATWIFSLVKRISFLQLCDALALGASQGILWGRIGNFINGELYGRVTDSWVGVVFPRGGPFPRHPSQLYEGILEGLVVFVILFIVHRRQRFYGVTAAAFFALYGIFRFIVEFFREPDPQLGYYLGYFTMGQLLCLMMLPVAFIFLRISKHKNLTNPLIIKA